MIDPLLSAALSLPARTNANEAPPGTPSFLPWALGVSAQGGQGDAQNQGSQRDVTLDLSALDVGIGIDDTPAAQVLETGQWTECLSAIVELHMRNPQGEQEVVAMPWRLMASGRLAQSLGAHGFVDQALAMRMSHFDPVASALVGSAQPAVVNGYGVATGLPGDAFGPGAPASLTSVLRTVVNDDVAPLSALLSSSPAAIEWLARLMKWIERDGQNPMVLLRDFRIDDDEARRLVDSLRAFAQEHGVGLDRIVVNGREFWRRPDLSQAQE